MKGHPQADEYSLFGWWEGGHDLSVMHRAPAIVSVLRAAKADRYECSNSKDGISTFSNTSGSRGSKEHGCGGYEAGDEARTGACAFEKSRQADFGAVLSSHLSTGTNHVRGLL